MAAITYPDLVDDRADQLALHGLDGLHLALVALPPGNNPDHADIELHFITGLHDAAILADIGGDPVRARQVFRIRGGTRIVAGNATGQVQVTAASPVDAQTLSLRVAPVGDYLTYTIELVWDASRIDPFFSRIDFKFRPGCFTNDCAPPLPGRPPAPGPVIDEASGSRGRSRGRRLQPSFHPARLPPVSPAVSGHPRDPDALLDAQREHPAIAVHRDPAAGDGLVEWHRPGTRHWRVRTDVLRRDRPRHHVGHQPLPLTQRAQFIERDDLVHRAEASEVPGVGVAQNGGIYSTGEDYVFRIDGRLLSEMQSGLAKILNAGVPGKHHHITSAVVSHNQRGRVHGELPTQLGCRPASPSGVRPPRSVDATATLA